MIRVMMFIVRLDSVMTLRFSLIWVFNINKMHIAYRTITGFTVCFIALTVHGADIFSWCFFGHIHFFLFQFVNVDIGKCLYLYFSILFYIPINEYVSYINLTLP